MKAFIAAGIGDMMCLDSLLKDEEKQSITEIYWACRFGKDMIPLFENNPYYPNLKQQHTIEDSVGKEAMKLFEPWSVSFWHFRPDFRPNFLKGLELFGLKEDEVTAYNLLGPPDGLFLRIPPVFETSSILKAADTSDVDWDGLNIKPHEYILVHLPTSSRPRRDAFAMGDEDVKFLRELSDKTGFPVVAVTDYDPDQSMSDFIILNRPDIATIPALVKYSAYCGGCDSFISILGCKMHQPDKLFVKTAYPPNNIFTNPYLQHLFGPHDAGVIRSFYDSKFVVAI